MKEIFLSASVPLVGRGNYYETADPFLIQFAVRELVIAVIRQRGLVWGGHPAITPMIWAICKDLGVDPNISVTLYQSKFFASEFPEENKFFSNIILEPAVDGDKDASLKLMRERMLSRKDLEAAVFIGGMEGVEIEYEMFRGYHPDAKILLVSAPGGAARQLAERIGVAKGRGLDDIDFARYFHTELGL